MQGHARTAATVGGPLEHPWTPKTGRRRGKSPSGRPGRQGPRGENPEANHWQSLGSRALGSTVRGQEPGGEVSRAVASSAQRSGRVGLVRGASLQVRGIGEDQMPQPSEPGGRTRMPVFHVYIRGGCNYRKRAVFRRNRLLMACCYQPPAVLIPPPSLWHSVADAFSQPSFLTLFPPTSLQHARQTRVTRRHPCTIKLIAWRHTPGAPCMRQHSGLFFFLHQFSVISPSELVLPPRNPGRTRAAARPGGVVYVWVFFYLYQRSAYPVL